MRVITRFHTMNILQDILGRREMLNSLVSREMKSRYRGSVLGALWSVLNPLIMAVIYVFFLRLLARGVPMEEIIIGVFAWTYSVQAINAGMDSVTGNTNLVKKIIFPRLILPVSAVLASLINFLFSLIVQFILVGIMLAIKGTFLSWWSFAIPLIILLQTVYSIGIAAVLGALNVYYRDTQHLIGVLISAWFFMSPVMYTLELIAPAGEKYPLLWDLYMLNPLVGIVTAYRAMILPYMDFPWSTAMVIGLVWPILFFFAAIRFFQRAQRNFADML